MGLDAERESVGNRGVSRLFILECDRRGKMLWMSDHARSALARGSAEQAPRTLPLRPMRFLPVLECAGKIWLGVCAMGTESGAAETDLLPVEHSLLGHHHRLARAERRLSAQARRKRGGGLAIWQLEMERQRIGRDLHSGVGQMLAAIRLQIEVIEIQLPSPPPAVQQAAARISQLAHDALEQVRAVSRRLHPPEWQRLTLESAVLQLWDLSGIPLRFEAALRVDPLPAQPDLETKSLMYRAAQEAFSNLARHARATRAEASLAVRDGDLVLTVHDNGGGFDVARALSGPPTLDSGIGLRTIGEQAAALGATLDIQSGPVGTTLVLSAPFLPHPR
ncbi:MAG: sensor histidine kinase [Bryobacteraceae bacterium]